MEKYVFTKEETQVICTTIHGALKQSINASINTKIYGDSLVVTIKRLDFSYKKKIDNLKETLNEEGGLLNVVIEIENGYSDFIFKKFFYSQEEVTKEE